ncbi:MAG: glycosyltransferase family 2 protein [Ignavibacteriae bacterium]|nr:MAG: glycosyltransferase family 2 protein [Ignavibacteriota bacterium]
MKKVGVILVVYNQKDNLRPLYESLCKQSYKNFTVYFIDNKSTDGSYGRSIELNQQFNLDIKYISPGCNMGFAKGNNIGAEEAVKDKCEYLFILNNDIELDEDCLKNLIELANQDEKTAITSPIIFYGPMGCAENVIQEYGSRVNFHSYHIHRNYPRKVFEKNNDKIPGTMNVNFVSGGALLIKSSVYKKIGLWEERYFAYGDEIDLMKRIKEAGFIVKVTKKAKLWHNHKWDKDNKWGYYFEYYMIERNKFLYYHKCKYYFSLFFTAIGDILKFPWRLLWFKKVCDFKLGYYYLAGLFDGLKNKGGKPDLIND